MYTESAPVFYNHLEKRCTRMLSFNLFQLHTCATDLSVYVQVFLNPFSLLGFYFSIGFIHLSSSFFRMWLVQSCLNFYHVRFRNVYPSLMHSFCCLSHPINMSQDPQFKNLDSLLIAFSRHPHYTSIQARQNRYLLL